MPSPPSRRYLITVLVFLTLSVLIGVVFSTAVNSFLAIRFEPKNLPVTDGIGPTTDTIEISDIDPISGIIIQTDFTFKDHFNNSLEALFGSLAYHNQSGIPILSPDIVHPPGYYLAIGNSENNAYIPPNASLSSTISDQSFGLRSYQAGGSNFTAIISASELGMVYGIYWLAEELETGKYFASSNIRSQNATISPKTEYRMVGQGGVGMLPNETAWRELDYSLNNREYEDLYLRAAPYINETAFVRIQNEFEVYLNHIISLGYNTIVMKGFLEFLNFDYVGNGYDIYSTDSDYRERQIVQREAFSQLFSYADDLGVDVILSTDMLALSAPLSEYFETELGGIDPLDDRLWNVYQQGLRELFDTMPSVDGLMIRIGEAGAAYNLATELYTSELQVTTKQALRTMLDAFLQVMEEEDKLLIFRTWSVGVGEIGDMHTNVETYNYVMDGLVSDHLIVSTKYSMGDFYGFLPFNPTLLVGEQRRMIEFQARREFEGFNAFPNYMGETYQKALQFAAQNENLAAIWLWTQDGGPMRAGPMSIYPFHGFWLWIDANVYITSKLAWDTNLDLGKTTQSWVIQQFGTNPTMVTNMTTVLLESRAAVEEGLYINEFAEQTVFAFGLEPPPMLWIFEWNRVSTVTSVLSGIYLTCKNNLSRAIQGGFDAIDSVNTMIDLVLDLDILMAKGQNWFSDLISSLEYEKSLFTTLAWYRKYFLSYFDWIDNGGQERKAIWEEAFDRFDQAKQKHIEIYGQNLDFPAYNFQGVDLGITYYERSTQMPWIDLTLTLFLFILFLLGSPWLQSALPNYPGKSAIGKLFLAVINPYKVNKVNNTRSYGVYIMSILALIGIFGSFLLFTAFHSILVLATLLLLSCSRLLVLHFLTHRRVAMVDILAASSSIMILGILVLSISSIRGPALFWYYFWTNPLFRTLFLTAFITTIMWQSFSLSYILRGYDFSRKDSISIALAGIGVWWILAGVILLLGGLENSLNTLNNELLLVPIGLHDILGIATHLGIPSDTPLFLIYLGLALIVPKILLVIIRLLHPFTQPSK